jgi:hypothetical protein
MVVRRGRRSWLRQRPAAAKEASGRENGGAKKARSAWNRDRSVAPRGAARSIDHEFSAVCRAIWGFTLDDFTDDDLSPDDHVWLDSLTQEHAFDFAVCQGYDLKATT